MTCANQAKLRELYDRLAILNEMLAVCPPGISDVSANGQTIKMNRDKILNEKQSVEDQIAEMTSGEPTRIFSIWFN